MADGHAPWSWDTSHPHDRAHACVPRTWMRGEPFSSEAVRQALRGMVASVESIEVVERFGASSAEVARLRVSPSDGRAPFTVIGKSATGAGLADARQELR